VPGASGDLAQQRERRYRFLVERWIAHRASGPIHYLCSHIRSAERSCSVSTGLAR
jgi:hypothetical protein